MKYKSILDKISYYLFLPVLNKNSINLFKKIKKHLLWNIYKIELKKIGKNSSVNYPFTISGGEYIEIGDDFNAGSGLILEAWSEYRNYSERNTPSLVIGNNVSITDYCHISCMDNVTIGNGVLFGRNVFISDNFHGGPNGENLNLPPVERNIYSNGKVIIGDNVWLGKNVCVMPGTNIGTNSIIGANAVVTSDIPANSIAVGVPAKVIRTIK